MPPTAPSRPSDPEFTRAQGTTFLFSRCFTANKDTFGCTTCHDPHRPVKTSPSHDEAKCLSCHAATSPLRAPRGLARHPAEVAHQTVQSCPISPAENCISCHMPKVEDLIATHAIHRPSHSRSPQA